MISKSVMIRVLILGSFVMINKSNQHFIHNYEI